MSTAVATLPTTPGQRPALSDSRPAEIDFILRLPEVERMCGLKKSVIYARIGEGTFPKSLSLGAHHVGWLQSEIQQWIRNLAAAR